MRLAAVVVVYLACELVVFAFVSTRYGRVFTFSAFEARPRDVTAGQDPFRLRDVVRRIRIRKEVVHPYLGYVYDPTVESASPYGISDISPIQHRSPDTLIVAVFGGSYAEDIAHQDGPIGLAAQLEPYFPGKEIVVVKSAIGGYKQPQQLMALDYFTALGGEFDVVINVDGFNEVALPRLENIPNTNPFFPRQWHLRVRMAPDTDLVATIGEIRLLDALIRKWSDLFYSGPLRYSVTANTIWRVGDQLLYRQAVARRARLPRMSSGNDFVATGPPAVYANEDDLDAALAGVWAESSYGMQAIAAARGFRYFHFLQPNQYLEGTKPMQAEERRIAIKEDHPYASAVRRSYPVLRRTGQQLRERGVNFVDLTGVYATVREPLYVDNCCHVNPEGRRLVITAIAKAVAAGMPARE